MKKIGRDFRLLAPKAEQAIIPIWLVIAKRIAKLEPNYDTIFWTTDYLGGTLAVRWFDSADEDAAISNVLLYSTPHIAEAIQVMEQILGDRFSDTTLREFQSIYEIWVDYVLRASFESSKVQVAFQRILASRKPLSIISTTADEGLAGAIRIVWQTKGAEKRTGASIAKSGKPARQAKRRRAMIDRKRKN